MSFFRNLDYISIIPLFTLFVILGSGIAAIFSKPTEFQNTRVSVFISIMGSAAVIILGVNVYLNTIGLENQRIINKAQYTKSTIDKLWLFPNELLATRTNARPEFLASLYYNNLTLFALTKELKTPPTVRSELDEQYISITLIQCWEDYLTLRSLDHTGDEVWLCNFLQWAQSPYLRKSFDTLKYNFASTTIEFGNLLFDYADRLPVPNTCVENYPTVVKELLKDSRLVSLFRKITKST